MNRAKYARVMHSCLLGLYAKLATKLLFASSTSRPLIKSAFRKEIWVDIAILKLIAHYFSSYCFWVWSFFWLLFLYLQMWWSFRDWETPNQRTWRAKRFCSGPPLCCRIRLWVTSLSSWDPLLLRKSMWATEFCWQWHLQFSRPCFMETWPTSPKSSE